MNSFIFRAVFLTIILLTAALLIQAQASRTWVSGIGDDANPCSLTAPCKTFTGALSKTASGGEINCLTPGGFGAVTIAKSVTIDCTGTYASILVASGNAITINPTAAITVRIRGISINGLTTAANGIIQSTPGRLIVENTVIDGFTGSGIFMQNTMSASLLVDNCTIRNNTGVGVNVQPTSTLAVTNTTGTISNSRIMNNSNQGLSTSTSDFAVANCIFSGNSTGILAGTNGTIRISGSTITENFTGISVGSKGFIVSYGNNVIGGNFTSDGTPSSTVGLR